MLYQDFPQRLRELCQWVCWRYDEPDNRKVPYQPNGKKAKSNDPETWSDLESCLEASKFDGVGFVFAGTDLWGIDLDACVVDGIVEPWAAEILNRFPTYSEYSPSGTGIKIFGFGGTIPTSGRKKNLAGPKVNGKSPGIEVYSKGRYFTFTGERANGFKEVNECGEAFGNFMAIEWPQVAPQAPQRLTTARAAGMGMSPAERAARYLDELPPAVSGCGGHNATFRAACVLVVEFGLSVDEAFPILANWNLACSPPWTDKELWHKLKSADASSGPRCGLLDESLARESDNLPTVDLSGLGSCQCATDAIVPPSVPPPKKTIPHELLDAPGFLREVVNHNLATARYPQLELAFCGALALLATITGRKIQDVDETRTNIYVVCPAPSGSGKEHSRKLNKQLLSLAGYRGDKMIGPEGIGSQAGLVTYLNENPAALFQLDEFADFMESTADSKKQPHKAEIITKLLTLYTSSNTLWISDALADSKKVKRINQPHAVLYGTCTPENFWNAINSRSLNGGFIGRLISLEAGYVKLNRRRTTASVPQSLIERVQWWLQFNEPGQDGGNLLDARPAITIPHSLEASRRIESQAEEVANRLEADNATGQAIWSRSTERTSKLALLFAASRMGPDSPIVCIEQEDAERAIAISNWITRHMLRQAADRVSESDWEAKKLRVLRTIGDGISRRELSRKLRGIKGRDLREALQELVETGDIEQVEVATGARASVILRRTN